VTTTVAALVCDLMFLSRIREAASASGLELRAARSSADLLEAANGARLVIVDLDDRRASATAAVNALRARPETAALPVIGFFSHVHAERARDAVRAGCTRALPRSVFVEQLAEILNEARASS
jgi:CheY-like chemotaxis protein